VRDYELADPTFASLSINPKSGMPMAVAGWEEISSSSAAFVIRAQDLLAERDGRPPTAT